MITLDNFVQVTQTTTPQVISHYNLFRSAEIDGRPLQAAAPATLSTKWKISRRVCREECPYEWSGLSLEEIQSGSKSAALFGLGLLVVYLTLSAQYESFALPFIVSMAVPMALLGALLGSLCAGLKMMSTARSVS